MLQQSLRCYLGKEEAFDVLPGRHESHSPERPACEMPLQRSFEGPRVSALICNLAPMLSWVLTRSSDPQQLHPATSRRSFQSFVVVWGFQICLGFRSSLKEAGAQMYYRSGPFRGCIAHIASLPHMSLFGHPGTRHFSDMGSHHSVPGNQAELGYQLKFPLRLIKGIPSQFCLIKVLLRSRWQLTP